MPDSRPNLDGILLDLHPSATAVPELAPCHIAIYRLAVQLQASRKPLDEGDEAGAV
jgi:hypothetical protein